MARVPVVIRRIRPLLALLAILVGLVGFVPKQPGAAQTSAPVGSVGGWLAGDLHVHTYYSHDVCKTPLKQYNNEACEDPYVYGFSPAEQIRNAEERGLDYVALTDHNTVQQQSDPGYPSNLVSLIPGYENSISGHAQMLGARRVYSKGTGSVADINAMANALRADGGLFQANHPMDPAWGYGFDVPIDTMEVWNLPWPGQRDILGDWNVASNNPQSVKLWETYLDRGEHVAATGGSDSHWRSTYGVQGVGEPTTWVYSADRSVEGILEGIRQDRTFITATPPLLLPTMPYLEADQDHDGTYESMVGATVPATSSFRVHVQRGAGQFLRIVTTGGHTVSRVPITSLPFTHIFRPPAGATWVRVETYVHDAPKQREGLCLPVTLPEDERPRCFDDSYWMSALTSPIFIGG